MFSLMVTGTPSSADSGRPASQRASAARACSRAPSRSTRYMAFSFGSSSAIRASEARVASIGESSRRAKAAARSAAERSCNAGFMGRLYTARQMLRCAILGRVVLACVLACACMPALAQWEIRVWHAMNGALGADFERLAARFNAAQTDYRVVLTYQGGYDETLASALSTRARGSKTPPPHVVHIHETGSAEMLTRRGLVMPLWQVLEDAGERLDGYLPAVEAPFADADGRLLALPFSAATPVLYYNRDALRAAK